MDANIYGFVYLERLFYWCFHCNLGLYFELNLLSLTDFSQINKEVFWRYHKRSLKTHSNENSFKFESGADLKKKRQFENPLFL